MKRPRARQVRRRAREPNLFKVARGIADSIDSPARMIELYYWSQEPGLCEFIRAVLAMRPEVRALLIAFLTMARDGVSISATLDKSARLTLESAEITEVLEVMRTASIIESCDGARTSH